MYEIIIATTVQVYQPENIRSNQETSILHVLQTPVIYSHMLISDGPISSVYCTALNYSIVL